MSSPVRSTIFTNNMFVKLRYEIEATVLHFRQPIMNMYVFQALKVCVKSLQWFVIEPSTNHAHYK